MKFVLRNGSLEHYSFIDLFLFGPNNVTRDCCEFQVFLCKLNESFQNQCPVVQRMTTLSAVVFRYCFRVIVSAIFVESPVEKEKYLRQTLSHGTCKRIKKFRKSEMG